METIKQEEPPRVIDCSGVKSKEWFAWVNVMPPGPSTFHVKGLVKVSNPGIIALLVKKEQSTSPNLLFDILLIQRPGTWPQVVTWVEARYDFAEVAFKYSHVHVLCGDKVIAKMPVQIIQ